MLPVNVHWKESVLSPIELDCEAILLHRFLSLLKPNHKILKHLLVFSSRCHSYKDVEVRGGRSQRYLYLPRTLVTLSDPGFCSFHLNPGEPVLDSTFRRVQSYRVMLWVILVPSGCCPSSHLYQACLPESQPT